MFKTREYMTEKYMTGVWPSDSPSNGPNGPPSASKRTKVRTLFISDVHLGTRACQAELLTKFLRSYEAEVIFLVGDIMEYWFLKSKRRWNGRYDVVINELLKQAEAGTRIIYIPGNHDHNLRRCAGETFNGIEIKLNAIHESADGRKYLVTHGDQFDVVMQYTPWLASIGHIGYHTLLTLNTSLNLARRSLGLRYWSLSEWCKRKVKRVVTHISHFEDSLLSEARACGAQGVICGHIHYAADRDIDGMRYLNSGDWVETCSGIVEHPDGRFELVRWTLVDHEQHGKAWSGDLKPAQTYDVRGGYAGLDSVLYFHLRLRSAVYSRTG